MNKDIGNKNEFSIRRFRETLHRDKRTREKAKNQRDPSVKGEHYRSVLDFQNAANLAGSKGNGQDPSQPGLRCHSDQRRGHYCRQDGSGASDCQIIGRALQIPGQ